jgi:hypothetical protein
MKRVKCPAFQTENVNGIDITNARRCAEVVTAKAGGIPRSAASSRGVLRLARTDELFGEAH